MTITIEDLDEMRARLLCANAGYSGERLEHFWRSFLPTARAIRAADEAAGLPTEALLAVLNGTAVIVPKAATVKMQGDGVSTVLEYLTPEGDAEFHVNMVWSAMLAASPWAKKEGVR